MTLTDRFTERIRASIERTRANLEKAHANYQAIANGEHGDTIDRTWENMLRALGALVAEWKPAESAGLAAHVARVVTFYVEALIPDTRLRELVLERLEEGEPTPWPPEVSPVDAAALLERIPDDAAAATVAAAAALSAAAWAARAAESAADAARRRPRIRRRRRPRRRLSRRLRRLLRRGRLRPRPRRRRRLRRRPRGSNTRPRRAARARGQRPLPSTSHRGPGARTVHRHPRGARRRCARA